MSSSQERQEMGKPIITKNAKANTAKAEKPRPTQLRWEGPRPNQQRRPRSRKIRIRRQMPRRKPLPTMAKEVLIAESSMKNAPVKEADKVPSYDLWEDLKKQPIHILKSDVVPFCYCSR